MKLKINHLLLVKIYYLIITNSPGHGPIGVLDLVQHGNGKRNARLCSFVLSCCRVISSMLVLVLVLVLVANGVASLESSCSPASQ